MKRCFIPLIFSLYKGVFCRAERDPEGALTAPSGDEMSCSLKDFLISILRMNNGIII